MKMASNLNERLFVGDKFASLVELESAITTFEKSHFVSLHKREAMRKHAPKRIETAKAELLYYRLKYCCEYGGKKFKKHG